jgi:hypothetical protein
LHDLLVRKKGRYNKKKYDSVIIMVQKNVVIQPYTCGFGCLRISESRNVNVPVVGDTVEDRGAGVDIDSECGIKDVATFLLAR